MSDGQRSSSLDVLTQFSCLVLLCGSVGLLCYTLQLRSQQTSNTSATMTETGIGLPVPLTLTSARKPLIAHSKPPELPADAMIQITCTIHERTAAFPITCFVVNNIQYQPFLMTTASRLTRSEWEGIKHINCNSKQTPMKTLRCQPDWIGTFTHDNHPNLLTKPDLADDLVWWKLPDHIKDRLHLRRQLSEESTPVWIKSTTDIWLKGRIASDSENAICVTMIDRAETDKLLGSIIVNETGEIVGTVLGGNDLIVTGASSLGLLKKLKESIPTR